MNRRTAALRGLSEYAVLAGVRGDNPVPRCAPRARPGRAAACWGNWALDGPAGADGWCGRRDGCPSCWAREVAAFVADLHTDRDRAIGLLIAGRPARRRGPARCWLSNVKPGVAQGPG